jgi:outer membrane receptor for ferric coprogen and ferric-rhodotorulic acid
MNDSINTNIISIVTQNIVRRPRISLDSSDSGLSNFYSRGFAPHKFSQDFISFFDHCLNTAIKNSNLTSKDKLFVLESNSLATNSFFFLE